MKRRLAAAALVIVGGTFVAVGVEYTAQRYELGPAGETTVPPDLPSVTETPKAPVTPEPATAPDGIGPAQPFDIPRVNAPPGKDDPAGQPAAAPSADGPPPPSDAQAMWVRSVVDGDTVLLQSERGVVGATTGITVRLIGVDTPETNPAAECYGPEAATYLRGLLPENTPVLAAGDSDGRDEYGRPLLYLWLADGRMVNFEIVVNGYGEAMRIWPNIAYAETLLAAEDSARAGGLGMWQVC